MSPVNSINQLEKIFQKLDLNGDGFLSIDELMQLLERAGIHAKVEELEALLGKNSLDFLDFCLFYDTIFERNTTCQRKDGDEYQEDDGNNLENDLVEAFKIFDLNGDGFITSEELQKVLSRLGLWDEHGGKDCRSMINVYDDNSDGVLDFKEFKNMMLLMDP